MSQPLLSIAPLAISLFIRYTYVRVCEPHVVCLSGSVVKLFLHANTRARELAKRARVRVRERGRLAQGGPVFAYPLHEKPPHSRPPSAPFLSAQAQYILYCILFRLRAWKKRRDELLSCFNAFGAYGTIGVRSVGGEVKRGRRIVVVRAGVSHLSQVQAVGSAFKVAI